MRPDRGMQQRPQCEEPDGSDCSSGAWQASLLGLNGGVSFYHCTAEQGRRPDGRHWQLGHPRAGDSVSARGDRARSAIDAAVVAWQNRIQSRHRSRLDRIPPLPDEERGHEFPNRSRAWSRRPAHHLQEPLQRTLIPQCHSRCFVTAPSTVRVACLAASRIREWS